MTWFVHCVSRLFLPGTNPHFQGFPHPGHLPCRFRRAKNSVYKGMHVRMLELKFRHAQCTKCINLFKVSACSRGIVFCSHFQSSSLSVARRVLKLNFELFWTCLTANWRPARSQSWIRCTRLLRSRFKFTIIVTTSSSTNRDVLL